jgi:hypothetical protein
MSRSYAEIATGWQGSGDYIGHDAYQNGIIDGSCDGVYMAGCQNNWASATWTDDEGIEHLSASGYFTTLSAAGKPTVFSLDAFGEP